MLESQIVPKSSENISSNSPESVEVKIYTDPNQATVEFDADSWNLKEEVKTHPHIRRYLDSAHILMKHQEDELALNLLRQASNLDSYNLPTLQTLAKCLEKRGRLHEALKVRQALIKVDYSFESICLMAHVLYKLEQDQKALESYYEALSILKEENIEVFEAYKNMGNIFVKQGDFEGAEEYYNKAYTMNPQSDILLVNLGTLDIQRNDFAKALYCFRKAVEIQPRNDKGWVGLAMCHNQLGDSELAWGNIETAIDINPANRTAIHLSANWGVRDLQYQKAIVYLQEYLSQVDEDEEMSLVLINLLCHSGQVEIAELEIERVLLWNPSHVEVRELKKRILKGKRGH